MVGIARARGCGTCRKRKIACGLEKPSCAQCIKSKRACTGYARFPIIIQHKVQADNHAKSVVCHRRPAQQQPAASSALDPVRSVLGQVSQVDPSPTIRQQLLEEYISFHVPKVHLGLMQRRLWLCQLPTMPHLTSALEVSTMALCVAKLSEVYDDQNLKCESLRLYQRGLRQLQNALWDPKLMYHEQTLAACITLATYELTQCPNNSKQGYISHTSGCERLIQLRGPEAHTDGLAHQVFIQFRMHAILYALDTKQPTFLSDAVWQKVPWQTHPKTLFDQVYDFVTVAPELLRQGEMLEYMDMDSQVRLASEMITKCWRTDRDLALFHDRLIRSLSGPVYWAELARGQVFDEDGEDGMLFPVAFHFPNLSVAHTILVFWGCQVMLWHGMCQIYGFLGELRGRLTTSGKTTEMEFELPALEHRADFAAPARNIFQSVEYCLMDELKDPGPKTIAGPLSIALETLRPYPAYRRDILWAEEAMTKVRGRSLRLLSYYSGAGNERAQQNSREERPDGGLY